jgi:SHS family sialic acid transporter-like MFS transporter
LVPGINHGFRGTTFPAPTFLVVGITVMFFGWLPLYLPELLPTRVRATGQGLAFNAGRILAAVGALQMGVMMQALNGSYAQAGAVISLVYGWGSCCLVRDRDDGQTAAGVTRAGVLPESGG